jgi:hypothetical protein
VVTIFHLYDFFANTAGAATVVAATAAAAPTPAFFRNSRLFITNLLFNKVNVYESHPQIPQITAD